MKTPAKAFTNAIRASNNNKISFKSTQKSAFIGFKPELLCLSGKVLSQMAKILGQQGKSLRLEGKVLGRRVKVLPPRR